MKLLAIDGNSLINRAFYGIRPLSTKDGVPTNAIYGFLNILQKLRDELAPDCIAVAFDLHAPTFRHKMYDAYKAGRKPMPDDLRTQIPLLKELLRTMGLQVLEQEGFEADDILGTLAALSKQRGHTCYISTGDRDALQLVDEQVNVWLAATKNGQPEVRHYNVAKIAEEFGLTPARLIDVKALQGDSSDNIPGVAGVGPKTACALIAQYGSLQALYDGFEADAAMRENLKLKLRTDRDNAFLSYTLGTINCAVPLADPDAVFAPQTPDRAALCALLRRLEFYKLIEKWNLSDIPAADDPCEQTAERQTVACLPFEEAFARAQTEPFGLVQNGDGWALVLADALCELDETQTDTLLQSGLAVMTDNAKALFARGEQLGTTPNITFDTTLAGYLLDPSSSEYSVSRLAQSHGISLPQNEQGETEAVGAFLPLCQALKQAIEQNEQASLLYEIEIPLAQVLASMEREGVLIDADATRSMGEELGKRIDTLSREIYDAVGYEFNLNSPKQLGEALFEKLALPHGKKTKNGYSTDAKTLEGLRGAHPAVDGLLEYRQLAKLKSTYCDGLLKVIDADGRIRSTFNQTETRTGRISSTEPNLQNIPVRSELGRELRRFFAAKEGCVFCDADYSQIELRILAHMANDPAMLQAFQNGEDIHTATASQVFGIPMPMVTPLMRSHAKAVNFGIVYGIGAYSLSKDLGISFGEARDYIQGYLNTYPQVARYMEQVVEQSKETGWCETLLHRRRYLPELSSSNAMLRAFGERVARNMPVQGTAADIIKIAMVRVWRRLKKEGLAAKLILQVHDELIVEAPEQEAEYVCRILQEEMQGAVALQVQLPVEVNVGKSWYEAK